jgi:hypothetical protein
MRPALSLLAITIIFVLITPGSPTTTTTPCCSLNGVCLEGGTCVCDPGWSGPTCGNLTLAETDPTLGHPWGSGSSSWGGLPLKAEDGTYHLFYSQFVKGCGLSSWSTNSRIVHAVAPSLGAPFVDVDVVEPAFSHNAQAMRAVDGTWVVWYIGCGQGEAVRDCGGSPSDALPLAPRTAPPRPPGWNPSPWCSPMGREALGEGYITYSSAPTPHGPWTPLARPAVQGSNRTDRWDTLVTNPAPWVLPNGSVLLGLSGDNGSAGKCIGMARAATWNGSYTPDREVAVRGGEDPFVWVNPRGDAHVIYHDVAGTSNGGHAFAPASNPTQWTLGTHALYTGRLVWPNGTQATVYDRERPKLVFEGDGGGAPLVMMNGIAVYRDGRSFTAVTRVGA